MLGCLRRLGCLVLVALLAAAAWFTRDWWMPYLRRTGVSADSVAAAPLWQRLTPTGADSARRALERLREPRGPAYVDVLPGDLAAYIVQELSRTLPASADSIEAAAIGDRLYVRASVRLSELGDAEALGPLRMLLGERERLQMGGTLRVIRPGLSELQVKELMIRDLTLPQPLIPRLIGQISGSRRTPELAPDGLPLQTPEYIGDVRVSDGRITMYRSVP